MYATHKLMFRNPEVKEGINTTMRRGIKWDIDANKGDAVEVVDQNGKLECVGTVAYTQVFKFSDLAKHRNRRILDNQHDRLCKNYLGLLDAMCMVYPEFNEDEIVTVVTFNI